MSSDLNFSIPEINIDEEIKTVNEIFRYNLKMLRASEELSGEELSNKLQMPVKRINDLEGGRMPPNLEDLIKIVKYYPITFDDLLDSKIGLLIKSDSYSSALLQQTPCTTQSVPTDEQIDEIWEERNSSGTYLEGNLCRREGAKKIRDMMLGVA